MRLISFSLFVHIYLDKFGLSSLFVEYSGIFLFFLNLREGLRNFKKEYTPCPDFQFSFA